MTRTPCYVFDIDGTLADDGHRQHHLLQNPKDCDAYHELVVDDVPHVHIVRLAQDLMLSRPIIFCTGRHDGQRRVTEAWIEHHTDILHGGLYMRKEGDHRPDAVVKLELLAQIRADGFEPIMVFDDRNSVVQMWRDNGVPCAQVAIGDF